MKKWQLKNIRIILLIICILHLIGCSMINKFPNLVRRKYLTVGIDKNYERIFGETHDKVKKILESFAEETGLEVEYKKLESSELLKSLDNKQIDVAVGSFVHGDTVLRDYEMSFVYNYEYLYCVTNYKDYVNNIIYLDNDATLVSRHLSNVMKEKIGVIKKFNSSIKYNFIDDMAKIEKLLNADVASHYYLCYRNDVLTLLKRKDAEDLYVNRLLDVDTDGLVFVSSKKNKKVIAGINRVIVNAN